MVITINKIDDVLISVKQLDSEVIILTIKMLKRELSITIESNESIVVIRENERR